MNKQGSKAKPGGGIEWTHIFGPGTGYTANPVRGCQHRCEWRMPDGNVAICYAKAFHDRIHGKDSFEKVTFHPEVLAEIRKHHQPAGIFIDSMSDLFALAVASNQIDEVMQCIRDCPQHIFFSLTKAPTRLRSFTGMPYPDNLCLGVSLPPTFMFGKELTLAQQRAWFTKALDCLCACEARVRWVSLEPLSWDCSDILAQYRDRLHWAVIGAASDGATTYQPDAMVLHDVREALRGVPIFYKGNLRASIPDGCWRAEWPKL